jgi:antitoxin (DNA-binding transcriptional repressor) of toxin-antitoxin stability system
MLVVSTREFRQNQSSYLNRIDEGRDILLQRGKNKSYRITPVTEDDTLMSKEEFFAKIDRALESYKAGNYRTVNTREELHAYLNSL